MLKARALLFKVYMQIQQETKNQIVFDNKLREINAVGGMRYITCNLHQSLGWDLKYPVFSIDRVRIVSFLGVDQNYVASKCGKTFVATTGCLFSPQHQRN